MNKEKNLVSLKKAQSHLAKVIAMVDADAYCIDIMQQNLAVIGLLKAVNQSLLSGHLQSCFAAAMRGGNEATRQKMVAEVLRLEKMSNK